MAGKLIVTAGGETGGGEATTEAPAATPAASPAASAAAALPTTLDVEMKDIAFDVKELTLPANSEITINLKNSGAATHNFNIDELDVHSGDYAGGQTGTVTFKTGAPGEFSFYCNIPGHKEAGMIGKVTVVEAGGNAAGATTSPAASGSGDAGAASLPTTVDVAMEDIKFDVTELTVPANSEVTVNLTNKGAATHNFNIDELNVQSGDYAGGQTGTVTIKTGAPGTYTYYCNIPGHKEAGMMGQLIVK
jgi:nitrite reductase (NO-forming)